MKTFAFAVVVSLISGVIAAEPFADKSASSDVNAPLEPNPQGTLPTELTGFKEIGENYFEAEPLEADSSRAPVRLRIRGLDDSSR
jgi:hypothetical protein